jgi:hypothetical protein
MTVTVFGEAQRDYEDEDEDLDMHSSDEDSEDEAVDMFLVGGAYHDPAFDTHYYARSVVHGY